MGWPFNAPKHPLVSSPAKKSRAFLQEGFRVALDKEVVASIQTACGLLAVFCDVTASFLRLDDH